MKKLEFTSKVTTEDVIRKKLLMAINEYKITVETLNKVMQIDIDWLSAYINEKKELSDLPAEELGLLFHIIPMLSDGMTMVSEDERIKGVIDVLVETFGLKYETISLYARLEKHDIENFMQDTTSLDFEKKYKLATTSMMLHYLFKNPKFPKHS